MTYNGFMFFVSRRLLSKIGGQASAWDVKVIRMIFKSGSTLNVF
jgi:hypothetical protein